MLNLSRCTHEDQVQIFSAVRFVAQKEALSIPRSAKFWPVHETWTILVIAHWIPVFVSDTWARRIIIVRTQVAFVWRFPPRNQRPSRRTCYHFRLIVCRLVCHPLVQHKFHMDEGRVFLFFVDIVRMPESGCEFHSTTCGRSGLLLRMIFAKYSEEIQRISEHFGCEHGTYVTLSVVRPWIGTNRHVCGDSFFASVETAESLYQCGLRCTGVMKTSTRRFMMKYLSSKEMRGRGIQLFLFSTYRME